MGWEAALDDAAGGGRGVVDVDAADGAGKIEGIFEGWGGQAGGEGEVPDVVVVDVDFGGARAVMEKGEQGG